MSAFFGLLRNSIIFIRPKIVQQTLRRRELNFARCLLQTGKLKLVPVVRTSPKDGASLYVGAGILGLLGLGDKEEEEPESDEDKLIHSIKLGILAMQQGNLDKSEYLLHVALKMAQDLQHDNGIYYVYTVLADLAFQQGDFRKCERLYMDILKREVGRGVPTNSNSLVEISLKLAQIFAHRNETDKAEQGFKFCIDTQEKKIRDGAPREGEELDDIMGLWGMSRDWYGQFLMARGRFSEAFSQFQEAFLTCCEIYGDTHPQSLVLLNSLGTVSSLMGKDDQAITYYSKAVRLARATECSDLPTFLVNLGMAKIKRGLQNEAETVCQEAYTLAKRNDSTDEANEAKSCIELVKSSFKTPVKAKSG